MAVVAADSADAFDAQVLHSPVPVVVDFWAPWCGPCRTVAPEVEALAAAYGDRLRFVKTNVDLVPEVAARYDVKGIPMIGLFHEGKLVRSVTGARPRHAIEQELALKIFGMQAGPAKAPPPGQVVEERNRTTTRRPDGRY